MTQGAGTFEEREMLTGSLAGSALGLMCGDALGAPVEGLPRTAIAAEWGWISGMMDAGRGAPAGTTTDDSQLMLGLLEALAEDHHLPPGLLARRYAENFQPWRGYGASTGAALQALRAGRGDPAALSRPSFGNGGAMGIAPLGVYFSQDLERVLGRAEAACRVTHHHPEAVAAAQAMAACAALLARQRLAGEPLQMAALLERLLGLAPLAASPMAAPLTRLAERGALGAEPPPARAAWLAGTFGATLRAVESVPVALGAALSAASLREAVEVGVNAGGDADTQGAMAGGLAGAYYGISEIPPEWLAVLENGAQGRDHVLKVVERLMTRLALEAPGGGA